MNTCQVYYIILIRTLRSNKLPIHDLVIENGEYAINVASNKKSDIKTLKTNVTIFYVMITNAIEVIANELCRMETFFNENSQSN